MRQIRRRMLEVDLNVEVRGDLQCSRACFQGAGLGPETENIAGGCERVQKGEKAHRGRKRGRTET